MKNTKLQACIFYYFFGYCLFLEKVYLGMRKYHAGIMQNKYYVFVEIQRM
jgi:hypothetical protein